MIQDIHPHTFSNLFIANATIQENDLIFRFKEDSLLLKPNGNNFEIPKKKELKGIADEGQFLFTLNNVNCFLVWECPTLDNSKFTYHEISFLRNISQPELDYSAAVAFHLKNWYAQNKFCGTCGAATVSKKDERAIECPSCKKISYPTISPAIIVAIRSNDKILLARNTNFRNGFYSLVAGYVDIGESIEDAVRREVKEEVGLDITNIRYYDSQPWPFSGSMMIGFIADGDDSQPIKIDNKEIVEAAWYTAGKLPNRPPNRSIAGEIIDKFERGEL